MSGLPISLQLDEQALEAVAQRVAAILADQASEVDPLLSVAEAADYLRAPKSRLYDLHSSGRLVAVKDGSRVLFRRSAIDAYLEGRGS